MMAETMALSRDATVDCHPVPSVSIELKSNDGWNYLPREHTVSVADLPPDRYRTFGTISPAVREQLIQLITGELRTAREGAIARGMAPCTVATALERSRGAIQRMVPSGQVLHLSAPMQICAPGQVEDPESPGRPATFE
jgi:hypothetical protein